MRLEKPRPERVASQAILLRQRAECFERISSMLNERALALRATGSEMRARRKPESPANKGFGAKTKSAKRPAQYNLFGNSS